MTGSTRRTNRPALFVLTAIWAVGIIAGSWAMLRHEFGVGVASHAPVQLPPDLQAFVETSSPLTLVMAVHPECPCTAASIEQLDRFLTQHPDSAQAVAFFWTHDETGTDAMRENRYWQRILAMPHARPVPDPQGRIAARLGAEVSGTVAAYDNAGKLQFQGGLTASRGHAGSSRAMDLLHAIAIGRAPVETVASAPAFGCSLLDGANESL